MFGRARADDGYINPLSLGNMGLWLDMADATTRFKDQAGTVLASADTDPIMRWNDKSGSARHATQANAAKALTLKLGQLNGLPGALFDGVDDYLQFDIALAAADMQTSTVYIVTSGVPSTVGTQYAYLGLDVGVDFGAYYLRSKERKTNIVKAGIADIATATAAIDPAGSLETAMYDSSGNYLFELNGVANGSGTSLHSFTDPTTYLGAHLGTVEMMSGLMYEVMVYTGVEHTADQRAMVAAYAINKWGL